MNSQEFFKTGRSCPECKLGEVVLEDMLTTCRGEGLATIHGLRHYHDQNRRSFHFGCSVCNWIS